jgi:hypothetical protein
MYVKIEGDQVFISLGYVRGLFRKLLYSYRTAWEKFQEVYLQ